MNVFRGTGQSLPVHHAFYFGHQGATFAVFVADHVFGDAIVGGADYRYEQVQHNDELEDSCNGQNEPSYHPITSIVQMVILLFIQIRNYS